ncbi:MAG: hypothetical protein OXB91_10825 [Bryobacterales bacterium]|nr:hypothetical protein [Bryobacterales bacterium]
MLFPFRHKRSKGSGYPFSGDESCIGGHGAAYIGAFRRDQVVEPVRQLGTQLGARIGPRRARDQRRE